MRCAAHQWAVTRKISGSYFIIYLSAWTVLSSMDCSFLQLRLDSPGKLEYLVHTYEVEAMFFAYNQVDYKYFLKLFWKHDEQIK